jgi:hypothetical protein
MILRTERRRRRRRFGWCSSVNAAIAAAETLGPLRISVDAHGGPASGGRLVGKDGSPLDLEGFKTTITFYLTTVFNVMRLTAAAIAKQEPLDEGGVIGMTLVAARDLSPRGIRVVTIGPGTINTRPTARQPTSWRRTGVARSRSPSG